MKTFLSLFLLSLLLAFPARATCGAHEAMCFGAQDRVDESLIVSDLKSSTGGANFLTVHPLSDLKKSRHIKEWLDALRNACSAGTVSGIVCASPAVKK